MQIFLEKKGIQTRPIFTGNLLRHPMMKNKIYPTQIAVEFDGFNSPSKKALSDYYEVDSQLRENGYLCYDFDVLADFLYVQSNRVKEELNKV